jgi:hypothetical protein
LSVTKRLAKSFNEASASKKVAAMITCQYHRQPSRRRHHYETTETDVTADHIARRMHLTMRTHTPCVRNFMQVDDKESVTLKDFSVP